MSNLKEKFKNLGWSLLGIGFFACLILLIVGMFWGIATVSAFLYPIFANLTGIAILLFLFVVLPLSLVHKWRPLLAGISYILSIICGATVWMYSFLVVLGYLGWIAVFFLFLFHFVAPIAIIGLFIKGEWSNGFSILLGLVFTYGMRLYAIWLEDFYNRKEENFIDITPKPVRTDETIKRFKTIFIIYISSIVLLVIGAFIIGANFPNLYDKSTLRAIVNLSLVYLRIIQIIAVFYLYKVSKILKLSGNLNIRPSLITILTIVIFYTKMYVLAVVPFIVVWVKANAYLKQEKNQLPINE